ncbi:MAG: hypothetical protein ACLQUT_02170 [Thermoleophilia bacterium]
MPGGDEKRRPSIVDAEASLSNAAATRRPNARRLAVVASVLAIALATIIVGGGFSYFHTGIEGRWVTVRIPAGASLDQIGALLASKHIVDRSRAFVIEAQGDGLATSLVSHSYRLRVNETYRSLISMLAQGAQTTANAAPVITVRTAAGKSTENGHTVTIIGHVRSSPEFRP